MLNKTSKLSHYVLLFVAEIFFAYQFILRISAGPMMSDVMDKFHLDATEYGLLVSLFYVGYAGFQVPIGMMLDKVGPVKIIAICALLCVLGNMTFILSDYPYVIFLGKFLIGIGSVAGFLGAAKTISLYFSGKHVTYLMSATFTIGYLGASAGQPLTELIEKFGWQNILNALAIIGLVIALVIMLIRIPYKINQTEQFSVVDNFKKIATNRHILLVSICGALQMGPLEAFADVWGINYFVEVYHLSKSDAASLTSIVYLSICVGCPLIAYLAEKFSCHYSICGLCGLLMCAIYILLLSELPISYSVLAILMLLVGILSGYQIVVFAITTKMVSKELTGVTNALTNMIIMSSGFFFHLIMGYLMDFFWQDQVSDAGNKIYNANSYSNTIVVIPITLLIGAIGFYLLKTKQRSHRSVQN